MKHPGVRSLALGACLCSLYIGYELARACTISLFTKQKTNGLGGAVLALGGCLLSLGSLAVYGRGVQLLGAAWTLFTSACVCSVVFVLCAVGLMWSPEGDEAGALFRTLVSCTFAFREVYVSVMGTQIWALLSVELKARGPEMSRRWFCIIQGVSCMCSALAGLATGRMVTAKGEICLLLATATSLFTIAGTVGIMFCRIGDADRCSVSSSTDETRGKPIGKPNGKKYSRTQVDGVKMRHLHDGEQRGGDGQVEKVDRRLESGGLWQVLRSSAALFQRNPLLAALLAETIVCQILTAIMNMSFNEAVRQSRMVETSLGSSARAAGFVGKSFAFIGLFSGVLQLVVMPWAMVWVDLFLLLRGLPLVAGAGYSVSLLHPGFRTATAAFAVTKILDYSIRGTALELVYQSMPEHERLLGKEAIATVGLRFGRTGAHMVLNLCSAALGGVLPQRVLMALALVGASLWTLTLRQIKLLGGSTTVRGGRQDGVISMMKKGVVRGIHREVGGSGATRERHQRIVQPNNVGVHIVEVRKSLSLKATVVSLEKGRKEL